MWILHTTNFAGPKTVTRSYATDSYYAPTKLWPNLKVLTEAHVDRMLFENHERKGSLIVSGLQFLITPMSEKFS